MTSGGPADRAQVRVVENESAHRFEAHREGSEEPVGIAAYELDGHTIAFTHTEVPRELQGQGIAAALVRGALDTLAERGGLRVIPRCSYVKSYIDDHPEYAELLSPPA